MRNGAFTAFTYFHNLILQFRICGFVVVFPWGPTPCGKKRGKNLAFAVLAIPQKSGQKTEYERDQKTIQIKTFNTDL